MQILCYSLLFLLLGLIMITLGVICSWWFICYKSAVIFSCLCFVLQSIKTFCGQVENAALSFCYLEPDLTQVWVLWLVNSSLTQKSWRVDTVMEIWWNWTEREFQRAVQLDLELNWQQCTKKTTLGLQYMHIHYKCAPTFIGLLVIPIEFEVLRQVQTL